jgi:predicted esterase
MPERPEPHHISVQRTARFWTAGPAPEEAIGTLYALHGYGQLGEYFIRKFHNAAEAGWHVVVPEGGHRFYLQGTEGRVGASWMTKEDRLSDIEDYVAFLDQLKQRIDGMGAQGPQILLGFSQGVATALRWLALGAGGPAAWQAVIAHSGVIPPDLPKGAQTLTSAPPLHLITGDEDPYYTDRESGFRTSEREWTDSGGDPKQISRHTFHGGHTIDPLVVQLILDGFHRAS